MKCLYSAYVPAWVSLYPCVSLYLPACILACVSRCWHALTLLAFRVPVNILVCPCLWARLCTFTSRVPIPVTCICLWPRPLCFPCTCPCTRTSSLPVNMYQSMGQYLCARLCLIYLTRVPALQVCKYSMCVDIYVLSCFLWPHLFVC